MKLLTENILTVERGIFNKELKNIDSIIYTRSHRGIFIHSIHRLVNNIKRTVYLGF